MARIPFSEHGKTPFEQLLGYNVEVLKAWVNLEDAFLRSARFTPELKEQVRRTLAFGNKCEYCMFKGKPDEVQFNPRQALAVAFADMIAHDHRMIEDGHFRVLEEEFTESEIAELCAYICFISACQTFGALMNLTPDDLPASKKI